MFGGRDTHTTATVNDTSLPLVDTKSFSSCIEACSQSDMDTHVVEHDLQHLSCEMNDLAPETARGRRVSRSYDDDHGNKNECTNDTPISPKAAVDGGHTASIRPSECTRGVPPARRLQHTTAAPATRMRIPLVGLLPNRARADVWLMPLVATSSSTASMTNHSNTTPTPTNHHNGNSDNNNTANNNNSNNNNNNNSHALHHTSMTAALSVLHSCTPSSPSSANYNKGTVHTSLHAALYGVGVATSTHTVASGGSGSGSAAAAAAMPVTAAALSAPCGTSAPAPYASCYYRAPLFLLAGAMQLMCWNAFEEYSRQSWLRAQSHRRSRSRSSEMDETGVTRTQSSTTFHTAGMGASAGAGAGGANHVHGGSANTPATTSQVGHVSAGSTMHSTNGTPSYAVSGMGGGGHHTGAAAINLDSAAAVGNEGGERAVSAGCSGSAASHYAATQERSTHSRSVYRTGEATARSSSGVTAAMAATAVNNVDDEGESHGVTGGMQRTEAYYAMAVRILLKAARHYRQRRERSMLDAVAAEDAVTGRYGHTYAPHLARAADEHNSMTTTTTMLQQHNGTANVERAHALNSVVVAGGTHALLCGNTAGVIVGLLDFYQWAQYDVTLGDFMERYCAS